MLALWQKEDDISDTLTRSMTRNNQDIGSTDVCKEGFAHLHNLGLLFKVRMKMIVALTHHLNWHGIAEASRSFGI